MTEPNASLRVTNLETLRILFTSVAEPRKSAAQDEIITTSARNKEKCASRRIATSELLEQISKRNRQLHWLKNQHASRKQQLSNYEHDVRAQIEELRKREAIISETQTALEEQTTWTKRSAEEIEARDAVIHELRAELEQRTACVERSAEEITQRDATISRLQIELDEQAAAWPKRFAEEVEARDTVIRELRAELEQGAACVKRSAEELTQRDATISRLQTDFHKQAAPCAK